MNPESPEEGIDPADVVRAVWPALVRLAGERVLLSLVIVRSSARVGLDRRTLEQLVADMVSEAVDDLVEGEAAVWVGPTYIAPPPPAAAPGPAGLHLAIRVIWRRSRHRPPKGPRVTTGSPPRPTRIDGPDESVLTLDMPVLRPDDEGPTAP